MTEILVEIRLGNIFFRLIGMLPCRRIELDYYQTVSELSSVYEDVGVSCVAKDSDDYAENLHIYDLQIIVPVYNCECYVERCIQSIMNQRCGYRVLITVVNDGSTDSSRKILSKFENDDNIEIIDQVNAGLSEARNTGLNRLRANYVMFVDSDDYLLDNAIEPLISCAIVNNSDIVQGGFTKISESGKLIKTTLYERRDTFGELSGFPWGKIFNSKLFKNVRFSGNYWFEDTLCAMVLFPLAKRVSSIDSAVYAYRDNPRGISHNRKNLKVIDTVYITRRLLEDRLTLGIALTQYDYEHFLRQVALNFKRINVLGNSDVSKKVFRLHIWLYRKYFTSFHTELQENKFMQKALQEDNYWLYQMASVLIFK